MLDILVITAPIYLLIAAGYGLVRFEVFTKDNFRFIGRLLVLVVLPALVFRAIARYDVAEVFNGRYLAVYALGSALSFAVGLAYARRLAQKDAAGAAFVGMGLACSNSVFVGYPILSMVMPGTADIALALCLLVENLLIIPATLVLATANPHLPWYRALAQSFMGLFKNPIFLAIVAGFALSILHIRLPALADRTLGLVAGAAAPLALMMIGGVLVGQRVQGLGRDLSMVVAGKLLIHPLMVLLALWLLPAPELKFTVAAVLMAAMPLPAVYPALSARFGLEGFTATALVAVTVVSFFTLNAWLWVTQWWSPEAWVR